MRRFSEFILEYRHDLADGTPSQSIQAHNGKDPNRIDKKILHTVGDYKPKEEIIHKPGTILSGLRLMNILKDYGFKFEPGKQVQIKNSPNAIHLFTNQMGQPAGKVIQTKPVVESVINEGVIDSIQTALDIAGLDPSIGTVADGANSLISLLRSAIAKEPDQRKKHLLNAGISAVSMIPFADVIKALKLRNVPKLGKTLTKGAVAGARGLKSAAHAQKLSGNRF